MVQYKLEQLVIARYLRLIPLDWNPTGRIGLRLEIYGCQYSRFTLCVVVALTLGLNILSFPLFLRSDIRIVYFSVFKAV